jgi:hypothetical protein
MNERIKLLEEQAWVYQRRVYNEPDGSRTYGEQEKVFSREKFAELIVRECGYHADIFESLGCPVDMDSTETKPSDYIKKQFGVEE